MPEAPDLEVIKDYLNHRTAGLVVCSAKVLRPTVMRSLAGDFPTDVQGRTLDEFRRQGKFLLAQLSGDRLLVVNPMLTGAFQYCGSSERLYKRTCFILSLSNDRELRYLDDRQMGIAYYVDDESLSQVPRLGEQGPDVLDPGSFEEFQERLRPYHGEIKGILTRGRVLAGIGNAYADEILFAAGIYPFRKKKALTQEETRRLFEMSREVVQEAIPVLRKRLGDNIHVKIRDFLKVHNKGGQACPRCGNTITQVNANQRITSYCRRCQPGLLLKN